MHINNIFNQEFGYFYNMLTELKNSRVDWKYSFMPDTEFSKMADPVDAAELYWKEMLYRAHITVLTSFFKSLRWIDGIKAASQEGLYYSFVVNLRGFIESCSDAFYTLKCIPLTIARDFEVIFQSI